MRYLPRTCAISKTRLFQYAAGVNDHTWTIGDDNRWGPDDVGRHSGAIQCYRQQRASTRLPIPCGFTFSQRIEISGCGSGSMASAHHPLVILESKIYETAVSASRDDVEFKKELVIQ